MTYPPARYLGDTGEVTAHIRPHDAEPDLVFPSGVRVSYLATSEQTGGLFGLYRWDLSPENTGADPHFHRSFTESFFVVSGTVALYDGDRWVDGTAGDYLHVPHGGLHAFKNESGEAASMLILFSPGAPREGYFEGLAALRTGELKLDEAGLQEFFDYHDNHSV